MEVYNAKEYVGNSDSGTATREKKDCSVWAYASAFNVDYDTAHQEISKRFGRVPKRGIKTSALVGELTSIKEEGQVVHGCKITDYISGPKTETKWKLQGEKRMRRMRIKTFVEKYPEGTYYILVRGHALVIKDGEMIDVQPTKFPEKRIVEHAFRVEPTTDAGSN